MIEAMGRADPERFYIQLEPTGGDQHWDRRRNFRTTIANAARIRSEYPQSVSLPAVDIWSPCLLLNGT